MNKIIYTFLALAEPGDVKEVYLSFNEEKVKERFLQAIEGHLRRRLTPEEKDGFLGEGYYKPTTWGCFLFIESEIQDSGELIESKQVSSLGRPMGER